jgi:hypothetical protein
VGWALNNGNLLRLETELVFEKFLHGIIAAKNIRA